MFPDSGQSTKASFFEPVCHKAVVSDLTVPASSGRSRRLANNAETVLQLSVAGVGIARGTDIVVGDAIQRGELVWILSDWHLVEPVPLFATTHWLSSI